MPTGNEKLGFGKNREVTLPEDGNRCLIQFLDL